MCIRDRLKEAGIITQPLTFKLYAGLKDKKEYVPGTYELNTKMAYDQIMTMMTKGNTEKEVVWVTFPEGQTLNQVATKLEENKVCSAEEFIKVTDTVSFGSDSQYGYEFYDKIPDDPLRYHKLEGLSLIHISGTPSTRSPGTYKPRPASAAARRSRTAPA